MVKVIRTEELNHSGVAGMKWGYNDGKRNGRRTAKELNDLKEVQRKTPGVEVSSNIEQDYLQADHMLRFLGITLDAHSNDEAVVRSMAIYKQMADTKDRYKNQYDWLKTFTRRLSTIGYDMKAVDEMIDKNKSTFQSIKSGGGTDADVDKKPISDDLMTSYKKNKSKREAIKKHDNTVSKSSKRDSSDKEDDEKKKSVKHTEIQNEIYLEHHGILGQKWGVRRYQNKDGSLTDAGRKRYGNYDHLSDDELRTKINRKRLENRYKDLKVGSGSNSVSNVVDQTTNKASKVVKTKYGKNSDVTKTTNAVSDVAKDTAKLYDKVNEAKTNASKDKIDLSNMSDSELQKAINRMQMELEMSKLDSSSINRGKKITADTLQTIGLVASTAVDVITLGILIDKVIKKI